MTYKAHFDGHAIILDEPVALAPGQEVEVEVFAPVSPSVRTAERVKYFGIFKDMPVDGCKYAEDLRSEWEGRP